MCDYEYNILHPVLGGKVEEPMDAEDLARALLKDDIYEEETDNLVFSQSNNDLFDESHLASIINRLLGHQGDNVPTELVAQKRRVTGNFVSLSLNHRTRSFKVSP